MEVGQALLRLRGAKRPRSFPSLALAFLGCRESMKGLTGEHQAGSKQRHPRRRFALGLLVAVACLLSLVDRTSLDSAWDCLRACKRALTPLPLDPHERALALLERQPIIGSLSSAHGPSRRP